MTENGPTRGAPSHRLVGLHRPGAPAGPCDHAAWGYASDAERSRIASAWLTDGLRARQRALYVADGEVEALIGELAEVPDVDAALQTGALVVFTAAEIYDLSAPIDPDRQLAGYAGAVEAALADGYTGLRVAADITPLVLDPARRAAHVRWEQVADRYMTDHPLAPICMYDTRRVEDVDAIASVHPLQGPVEPAFSLYGTAPRTACLHGEVDAFGAAALDEALRHLPPTDVLDLRQLAFLDGRAASMVHAELQRRREADGPIRVEGARPVVRRVWDLCGFDRALLSV